MISRWHLAAVLALIGMILVPFTVLAVVTCPYGIINDPYPGKCPRYTDTDQNGVCDISETDTGSVPVTPVPTTMPVSPASLPSGSGSGQLIQTGNDDDGEDDEDDDEGEGEDDEGSQNRERNRNNQYSGGSQLSQPGTRSIVVPTTRPTPGTLSPTAVNPTVRPTIPPASVSCPYGIASDPYPGKCPRYIDANGDGFCDFSVLGTAVSAATPTVPVTPYTTIANPTPIPMSASVSCPYGIVNDPYPGECPRYVDANRDGFCDLSVLEAVLTAAPTVQVTTPGTPANQTCSSTAVPSSVSCPYGIANDPYPGKCPAYLDANNDALCDLSQEVACGNVVLPATACPFGKVNDPYPGACAKYVDMNINGFCDYSENGTGGEAASADTGDGSGSVPPTGLLAAGMGAGCIVIGYSFGRGKK